MKMLVHAVRQLKFAIECVIAVEDIIITMCHLVGGSITHAFGWLWRSSMIVTVIIWIMPYYINIHLSNPARFWILSVFLCLRHYVPGKLLLHVRAWCGTLPRGLLGAGCRLHCSAVCYWTTMCPHFTQTPQLPGQKMQTGEMMLTP